MSFSSEPYETALPVSPNPANPDQATSDLNSLSLGEIGPEALQFLSFNTGAVLQLATFAALSEGFTVAIAEVNFAPDAAVVVQALKRHPRCAGVQFVVIDLAQPDLRFVLAAVLEQLADVVPEAGKKQVLILQGLERAIALYGEYPPVVANLNYARDAFPQQVPHPMILLLPEYAINRVARYARDFWSWVSTLVTFRSTRQTLETVQQHVLQSDRLYTSDAKPVKQERVDQLERLLAAYTPSPDAPETDNARLRLMILQELGDAYQSLSDYARARSFYGQALELAQTVDDRAALATAWLSLGRALPYWDNAPKALGYYEQALAFYREIGARLGEANTLKAIGDVLQFLDRRTEAVERYEQALAFYREIGDRLGEANALQELGKMQDDLAQALMYLEKAQQLYEQIGDRYSQSRNLVRFLAEVQLKLGQQEAAIQSLTRAAELAEGTDYEFFRQSALEKLQQIRAGLSK